LRSVESLITDQHYKKLTWGVILIPVSIIFYMLQSVRNFLYKIKVLNVKKIDIPVVIVGNITVGGTGKTPFIIELANRLIQKKIKVGIVSRGYKSEYSNPREVSISSFYRDVGDEPLLIKTKVNCPVFVGKNRFLTANHLIKRYPETNIILSDDGLQHYSLFRDYEFILVDGLRYFGNEMMLPAGPLREPLSRLKKADAIIVNDDNGRLTIPKAKLIKSYCDDKLTSISGKKHINFSSINNKGLVAITAIANPNKFFRTLKLKNLNFTQVVFDDHYNFRQSDFDAYENMHIIMTEKDAIKCAHIKHSNIWVASISLNIEDDLINNMLIKVGLN
jgi:tetraacyldisaccharide 4'-kinase